jgi:phenylalanyl-tRNA synthetase beta chain
MELELTRLPLSDDPVQAPRLSTYPVATQDVALVVDESVPAADVERALRDGAGPLLEAVRLFDVYRGEQVGAGRRSLAYSLRLRAPDRTLTVEEVSEARQRAVGEAARRTGAVQRGG